MQNWSTSECKKYKNSTNWTSKKLQTFLLKVASYCCIAQLGSQVNDFICTHLECFFPVKSKGNIYFVRQIFFVKNGGRLKSSGSGYRHLPCASVIKVLCDSNVYLLSVLFFLPLIYLTVHKFTKDSHSFYPEMHFVFQNMYVGSI